MISRLLAGYAVLAAVAIATPAAAQGTADQRAACTGDAFQFCGEFIPDVDRITACLKKNVKKISPACQAQFRPSSARARPRATPVAERPADRHAVY